MDTLTTQQRGQIVGDEEQFRLHVMTALSELKTDVKGIVGNGQPGRLKVLEDKVEKHEWYIALAVGGAAVIGSLITYLVAVAPALMPK